jgi:hypothetical protein
MGRTKSEDQDQSDENEAKTRSARSEQQ